MKKNKKIKDFKKNNKITNPTFFHFFDPFVTNSKVDFNFWMFFAVLQCFFVFSLFWNQFKSKFQLLNSFFDLSDRFLDFSFLFFFKLKPPN